MPAYKELKHYRLVKDLPENKLLFKGKLSLVTKRPKSHEDVTRPKFQSIWYFKTPEPKWEAIYEAVAQELYRLILPRHPKTRFVIDNENYFIASKEVPNAQLLSFTKEDLKKNLILNNTYQGFGEILIVALWVNEIDIKKGNVLINSANELVKIDGGDCFSGQFFDGNDEISAKDLKGLPYLYRNHYWAFNWLDVKDQGHHLPHSIFFAKKNHPPQWRIEYCKTLLKIIFLPAELLKDFLRMILPPCFKVEELEKIVIARQIQLRTAALELAWFKTYLKTDEAQKDLTAFLEQLCTFHPRGKLYLDIEHYAPQMWDEFLSVRDSLVPPINKNKPTY